MLFWQCECGEKFEELGREEPGNDQGWRKAVAHSNMHKKNGEPERLIGLFDENGEMLFQGAYRPAAVSRGILPYGDWKEKRDKKITGDDTNPFKGRILVRDIPIDPVVVLCFYEAKSLWPEDYRDDKPETISMFITECVMGLFTLLKDDFNMGKIIERTYQSIMAMRQESEEPEGAEEEMESVSE